MVDAEPDPVGRPVEPYGAGIAPLVVDDPTGVVELCKVELTDVDADDAELEDVEIATELYCVGLLTDM